MQAGQCSGQVGTTFVDLGARHYVLIHNLLIWG
jgi:hypothetical protein